MEALKKHHKMVVGSFIKNKLQEFKYHLTKIISICQLVNSNYLAKVNPVDTLDKEINYSFNALVNTFQSLKDALETATGQRIAWSHFSNVRHSNFIKDCRNAITHDGMQIINVYSDGKYYIASKIERFDNYGKFITLTPPEQDILIICKEFTIDLMFEIENITDAYGQSIPTKSNVAKFEQIEQAFNNTFIASFAQDVIAQNRKLIENILDTREFNPVTEIKKETTCIRNLCNSTQQNFDSSRY